MSNFTDEDITQFEALLDEWADPEVSAVVLAGGVPGKFITHFDVDSILIPGASRSRRCAADGEHRSAADPARRPAAKTIPATTCRSIPPTGAITVKNSARLWPRARLAKNSRAAGT
jgi:hypothetical protein